VDDAAIRLWNVEQGKCHQVLKGGHKSTVATLAFSPDGQFLASSGKDRRLCVWQKKKSSTSSEYELAWAKDVAHKRIVWSVHFLPWKMSSTSAIATTDEPACHHILASGSRDGCIKIWRTQENNNSSTESSTESSSSSVVLEELTSFTPAFCVKGKPDAVTSLAFGPKPCRRSLSSAEDNNGTMALLAVGLESGRLELWKVFIPTRNSSETSTKNATVAAANLALSLPPWQCHLATITKLAWKPQSDAAAKDEESSLMSSILASSSMDHGVRVYQIQY
jgi:WD40 repeat protein